MAELKSEPLVSVPPDADEKEVFELFDKYNLRTPGRRGPERPADWRDRRRRRGDAPARPSCKNKLLPEKRGDESRRTINERVEQWRQRA